MQDSNREEWEFAAWHFLNYGTLMDDEDIEPYRHEVMRWKAENEEYIEEFLFIANRDMAIRMARTFTHEQMIVSRSINLLGIRTSDEVQFIENVLAESDEYVALREKGKDWESNPDYAGIGCVYVLFSPFGWLLERRKNKSREAYMQTLAIEYAAIDTYFRSIDVDADRLEKLHDLRNRYLNKR